MTWLLIVMLGTSISSSMVREVQCRIALQVTERMGKSYGIPASAVCIAPGGEVVRMPGLT
jgi:hypothetical protein